MRSFSASAFLLLSLLTGHVQATEHTVESRPDNTFSPRDLVIQVGDTVTWINIGGRHNVLAQDGSFRCAEGCDASGGNGDPSTSAWSFSLTFNSPDVIDYVCELHAGIGMVGTVTVSQVNTVPGTIRFTSASQVRSEGAGQFTVQVQRVDGSDGAVSAQLMTSDGSAQAGSDYQNTTGTVSWSDGESGSQSIAIPIINDNATETSETLSIMLSNPGGDASLGSPSAATLTIEDNDDPAEQPGTLSFTEDEFQTLENESVKTVSVERTDGSDGSISVSFTTQDGSARAGEDYHSVSGVLSWSDDDSSLKSFELALLDDLELEGPETINLILSAPTGGAQLGTSSATMTVLDDEDMTCVSDDDTLCLGQDDRFKIVVVWENFEGLMDTANAVDIDRRDSGLFYFFGEDNIEMLIKILDGCEINGHYWISYAATTDVGFLVTVTDTSTGSIKTYSNPVGNLAAPILDIEALAVCP